MTFENFLANSYDQNVGWVSALFIVVAIALVLGLEFRYKLDRETQEPYLLINSEDAQVKANDLLLEKSEK
jgi:hypothetical protein